ncbi:MAG: hypothetical protein OEW90_05010 [Betaproteobacteria bacterium]|nr:hypothetical protein [Betaproteobacteria bacterium]MDH4323479.1 hypothetical protein [Betaproteobacteria bacterium]
MTDGNGEIQRLEFSAFGLTVRLPAKRALEIITTASLIVSGALGFGLWQHTVEANDDAKSIKRSIEDANKATVGALNSRGDSQERLLKAILIEAREQTCLQRFDPKERKNQEQFCRRLAGKLEGE